ncbi:hypothetical protein ACT691_18170 [Vibrio metschnikovii]
MRCYLAHGCTNSPHWSVDEILQTLQQAIDDKQKGLGQHPADFHDNVFAAARRVG